MDCSFNSLFVGMCFAMIRQSGAWESFRHSFNSLFVGMCFAIVRSVTRFSIAIIVSIPFSSGCALQFNHGRCRYYLATLGFNSLFVGMCFAIHVGDIGHEGHLEFQFPFRRDVLCNIRRDLPVLLDVHVSIPFSSGCALQYPQAGFKIEGSKCFNSLFVGMCFAMAYWG